MIFINENDYSLEYNLFICDQIYEQQKFNNELHSIVLNEAISDEKKSEIKEKIEKGLDSFLDKMIDTLSKVVTKFLTKLHDFADNNKKYLETYKDIILNKKPLKAKISGYYEYDNELLKGVKLPDYDLEKLTKLPKDKNEYIKAVPEFAKYFKDPEKSFSDNAKYTLRGGEAKEVSAETLNMEKMYNFILRYNTNLGDFVNEASENFKKYIKRMREDIKRKAKNIKNTVKSKMQSNTSADKTTDNDTSSNNNSTSNSDQTSTNPDNKSNKPVNASFTYNKTLSYYFNEAIEIEDDKNQETPEKISGANVKMASNDGIADGVFTDLNNIAEGNLKLFVTCKLQLLCAWLTITEEAYRNYMRIIKWHVGKFVEGPETVTTTDGKEEKGNFTDTGNQG